MTNISHDIGANLHLKGTFNVPEKALIVIAGSITGTLIICKDAVVHIHGTINGNIFNEGGLIKVFGTVIGKIKSDAGITILETGSFVCGLDDYLVCL